MLRNTADRYGAVSITLHWCGGLSILAMLGTALQMFLAPDRAAYVPWAKLHASIGMSVYLVLAARIIWHFADRQPAKLSANRALNAVANMVHIVLLALIGLQLLSGPIDVWSGGFAIDVFGWFSVPSPFGDALKPYHDAIGDFHLYCGRAIGLLLVLHLGGVAKHVLINRDGTLRRMLGLPVHSGA